LQILPHRGAIVSELSMEEVQELFELRALLEPRLLKASARHLTEVDYDRLSQILQEYSSELRAKHVRRWGELNTEFHKVLYQHARQPRAQAIVGGLLQECDRHTRLQLSLTGGMERAEVEHAELVRLCRSGKVSAACALLKTHIEDVGKSLRNYFEEHNKTT
jgi:DNA-binding GntR family transcriptional regulator